MTHIKKKKRWNHPLEINVLHKMKNQMRLLVLYRNEFLHGDLKINNFPLYPGILPPFAVDATEIDPLHSNYVRSGLSR